MNKNKHGARKDEGKPGIHREKAEPGGSREQMRPEHVKYLREKPFFSIIIKKQLTGDEAHFTFEFESTIRYGRTGMVANT